MKDYKQVDPTTITFDFTNTKIKVNSPEESEWIQKVAFNSGFRWVNGSRTIDYTDNPALGFSHNETGMFRITQETFPKEFDEKKDKEITIQDILNNQMEEVIEVGDIIAYDGINNNYIVKEIRDNGKQYWIKEEYGYISSKNAKLISKTNKQEIIGYELLKDLPNVKAGTKSNAHNPGFYGFALIKPRGSVVNMSIHEDELQDTTWFKPIYKAKEVVVKISGGRVVEINDKTVVIKGLGALDYKSVAHLYNSVYKTSKLESFDISITHFKVGCQEFTQNDVEDVYSAIQKSK